MINFDDITEQKTIWMIFIKILKNTVFDDTIVDIIINKKLNLIELFVRDRKLY